MTENQHITKSVEVSDFYAPHIFRDFTKQVIKNYPNVTHCSHVKSKYGDYLRLIQSKKEYKFEFKTTDPVHNLQDLKNLEDRMFMELKG